MENSRKTYRVNAPTIVYEEIDGEAVIVNMQNGSYYSLDDSGAFIWGLLERKMAAGMVVETVAARYSGPIDEIKGAVLQLIDKLVEENLVIRDEALGIGSAAEAPAHPDTAKIPFQSPLLRKYSDMEELLLLDPVHETEDGPAGGAPDSQGNPPV